MLALLIPGLLMGSTSTPPEVVIPGRIVIPWNNAGSADAINWNSEGMVIYWSE